MRGRIAVALAMAALSLAACGAAKKAETYDTVFQTPQYEWGKYRGITLELWTQAKEMDRSYIKRALGRYEEQTGNTVKIVDISKDQFYEKTAAAFAAGSGPDLILSYGGTNVEPLNPDDNFYDFTQAPWVDDLTSTSINQTIYNGRVIGLPHWEASISGTIYNKKLFETCGIPVPANQAEFLDACETLLKNGITPMYLPYAEISMLLYQFPLDTVVEDDQKLSGLNGGTLGYQDFPEMRTVVQWYKTMADRGYFGESYEANNWGGMNEAMKSGEYGMMLCWDTWLYTDFDGEPGDFGLMPAFIGIPEEGTFEGPNLALMIVNRRGKQVDAAVDFITFMADPYNYNQAFAGLYTAPVFKNQAASISTPQYVEMERLIERNFRDSTAWLRIRGFSQMDAVCIQKYMAGEPGYTVDRCLEEMDRLRRERL